MNALDVFTSVGEILRRDEVAFGNSRVKALQDFLCGFNESVQKLLDDYKVEDPSDYSSDKTFVALAAPSLVGKTQAAFTTDDAVLRFLYFPLNNAQSLYRCFDHLKNSMINSAEQDLNLIKLHPPSVTSGNEILAVTNATAIATSSSTANVENPEDTDSLDDDFNLPDGKSISPYELELMRIQADVLLEHHRNREFLILGLWKAIILQSESCNVDRGGWLRKLSTMEGLVYKKETIENFRDFLQSQSQTLKFKYAVFLDEFVGDIEKVFIRNLARAVGLRCVVANTNTNVANLVGGSHVSSRASDKAIWSLVVNKLDSANIEVLNELMGFSSLLATISNAIVNPEPSGNQSAVDHKQLFVDWFTAQISQARPGIAYIYTKALRRLSAKQQENMTFDFALDFLNREIAKYLLRRKVSMQEPSSRCASLGLLVPPAFAYISRTTKKELVSTQKFKHIDFLSHHLYYVCNPTKKDDWKFLTVLESPSVLQRNYRISCFQIGDKVGTLSKFRYFSYFQSTELLTILACWYLEHSESIFYLARNYTPSLNAADTLFLLDNPNAPANDGNYLENLAAFAVAEASHSCENPSPTKRFTIAPKTAVAFLQNLLMNLSNEETALNNPLTMVPYPPKPEGQSIRRSKRLKAASNEDVTDFLNRISIPYIYGINRTEPEFEKLGMKSYTRTANSQQIDGVFDIKYEGSEAKCAVECKNYRNAIDKETLIGCIKKASGYKLSILLGTKFVGEPSDTTLIAETCTIGKVNLYRYEKINSTSFRFVPFPGIPLHDDPTTICLMIETERINPA